MAPVYVEAEKAGINVIHVRNEATAVFAADSIFRLTAILGIAVVTAGPGITNSITAKKNAELAHGCCSSKTYFSLTDFCPGCPSNRGFLCHRDVLKKIGIFRFVKILIKLFRFIYYKSVST